MADAGASLALGIAGTSRPGAVKCLHAHAAFALAQPGYALGAADPGRGGAALPGRGVLHAVTAAVELALLEWAEGTRRLARLELTTRRRYVVEAVVEELDAEIVRRVGQAFDLARLAGGVRLQRAVVPGRRAARDRRDLGV